MKSGIFVYFFVLISVLQAIHWSGSRLFDLECQGSNFVRESLSWNVMTSLNNKTLKTTQCTSDNIVLGGPGIWVTVQPISGWWRQYSNLPPHHGVTVQMKIYPIDAWAEEDHFSIQIESISEDYWVLNQESNPTAIANTCGPSATPDIAPLTVYRTVDHRANRLYLYIMTWVGRPSEIASIGVRDIVLTFFNTTTPETPIPTSTCGVAPYDLGSKPCSCDSSSVSIVSGKSGYCATCDETCLLCNKSGRFGCIACKAGDYLTEEGSCLKCASPCQTCSGDAGFCITCKKDGSEPSVNATCPPVNDECPSPLKMIENICQPDCPLDQYAYWNGCIEDCVFPLQLKSISSFAVCDFPCEEEEEYLYLDGTCSSSCSFEKSSFAGKNFCFPCNGFLYWNGTCSSSCPLPLISKKLGDRQICTYPCQSDEEFLYLDGSCQKECIYSSQITQDSKKFCNLICSSNRQELAADKKSCKNIELPGEFALNVILNNEPTKLSLIEIKTEEEVFSLFSQDYTIGSIWTFFALNFLKEYELENWSTSAKCGCFTQMCGRHCQQGAACFTHEESAPPLICHPWAERNNYCWSLISSGKLPYKVYSLKNLGTIALTSYGGLEDYTFVNPGFTITTSNTFFKYAVNGGIIKDMNSRDGNADLESSYRYAESEGKVIKTEEFDAALMKPPELKVDLEAATCNSSTIHLPMKMVSEKLTPVPFNSYLISRKAETANKMSNINNFNILTSNGLLKKYHAGIDFVDPCNQQFLSLQQDKIGNFFVHLPGSQKLMNFESVICIAVQDDPSSSRDLVLYELKLGTSIWSASDRFVGLLSNDYIQDYTLRLTTNADHAVNLAQNKIDIEIEVPAGTFRIKTTVATSCKIYLSPTCHFEITTTTEHLYASRQNDCGEYLYEKAAYDCQGIMGYFYPPASLVKTRTSGFVVNTKYHGSENFDDFNKSATDIDDIFSILYEWTTFWTWQNCLTKITVFFVLIIITMIGLRVCNLLLYICRKKLRPHNIKSKEYEVV